MNGIEQTEQTEVKALPAIPLTMTAAEARALADKKNSFQKEEDSKEVIIMLRRIHLKIREASEKYGSYQVEFKFGENGASRPNATQHRMITSTLEQEGFTVTSLIERCLNGSSVLTIKWK